MNLKRKLLKKYSVIVDRQRYLRDKYIEYDIRKSEVVKELYKIGHNPIKSKEVQIKRKAKKVNKKTNKKLYKMNKSEIIAIYGK